MLYLIYEDFPKGAPKSARTLAEATVAEYQKTLCHQYLAKHYQNRVTGEWTKGGKAVDAMGQYLYMKFGRHDPALFSLEDFRKAKTDPRFYSEQGKRKFAPLSKLRCIMKFAALQVKDSELSKVHFQFLEGDEWDTTGLKNIGGKKDDYLQEKELEAYVKGINEIDTLVLHRLSLEGGGRISSQLLMGTKLPNGYLCQPFWDLGAISMFEPKVELSKTGGKVKRYFVPETMAFFKRYKEDKPIVGAWFKRFESYPQNYDSYSVSLKMAGFRAGLWRYKTARKGEPLAEGEHLDAATGRVYKLRAVVNNQKGTTDYRKQWLTEGKMTTSHTVGKHTFVSLAGLHGLSLDDCAEQCGTDPTTIKDFYHGTLGDKLRAAILGEKNFEPWKEWVHRFVEPLYTSRYNELMSKGEGIDMQVIAQEELEIAEVVD
ncbi:MAG: hypothetical protein NWF05_11850 [Candidatus Bathyarchaeota archaeon]|nr:hypothetical protein [Candidatus Bathyarchaeota archaeon]